MLEQFKDIEGSYKVELQFIELKRAPGKPVPVLVCDRNLVLMYFSYVKARDELLKKLQSIGGDELDYKPTLKVYRELKARISRLEKAIYFKCEETGELRLFSSLVMHDGKIVHTKVVRDKIKQEQKQQAKIDLKQKQEEYAKSRRGKSPLELALIDGKRTLEDVAWARERLTREEMQEAIDKFNKYNHARFLTDTSEERMFQYCYHEAVMEKLRRRDIEAATAEKMKGIRAMMDHPVVEGFIRAAYEGQEERLQKIQKRKEREKLRDMRKEQSST